MGFTYFAFVLSNLAIKIITLGAISRLVIIIPAAFTANVKGGAMFHPIRVGAKIDKWCKITWCIHEEFDFFPSKISQHISNTKHRQLILTNFSCVSDWQSYLKNIFFWEEIIDSFFTVAKAHHIPHAWLLECPGLPEGLDNCNALIGVSILLERPWRSWHLRSFSLAISFRDG